MLVRIALDKLYWEKSEQREYSAPEWSGPPAAAQWLGTAGKEALPRSYGLPDCPGKPPLFGRLFRIFLCSWLC